MGCCCKSAFDEAYKTEQFQEWMAQFSSMQLSKREIKTLYNVFRKVDFDGGGCISLPELLAHIDLPRTKFTKRIFSIFDEDGSGEIDFKEFVLSLWNYCTLTKATLDMFAFDLYDKDSSGELSASEVVRMLKDIYGSNDIQSNFLAKSVANDLKEIERKGQVLDIEQFRLFAKTHQALLFPAFQMQLALQRKIMGVRFWERNAQKRLKFSNGKYISVGNFILFNVDAKKKPLLRENAPEVAAMQGAAHMDNDVGRMMEIAGTKAARRNTVMLNERKDGEGRYSSVELFSLKQKADYDTSIPMDETSKKAWLRAIFTMPSGTGTGASASSGGGASQSSKGMLLQPAKSVKQIQVSSLSSSAPAATAVTIEPALSGSGKPRRGSKDNSQDRGIDLPPAGGDSSKPRRNSKDKDREEADGGVGIAGAERGADSKKRFRDEPVIPSGRIKNPALTKDVIGKIEQVSPIEAWQNQSQKQLPPASGSSNSSSKKTRPLAAVTAGIAAVTASSKFRLGLGAGAGAGTGAGISVDTGTGGVSSGGKSAKNKHYSPVEVFEPSGFSDDEKDASVPAKAPARRNSLSRHTGPGAEASNNTWAESLLGGAAGDASASFLSAKGQSSSKRR